MIYANIKDAHRYYSVNPAFEAAFSTLTSLNGDSETGAIQYDGYKVIVSKTAPMDKNEDGSEREYEAHREYLDIHYCISGSERIYCQDVTRLTPTTEFNTEDDYGMLEGEGYYVDLYPGDFCVVFPEDAHMPLMTAADGEIIKAVVKIKVG